MVGIRGMCKPRDSLAVQQSSKKPAGLQLEAAKESVTHVSVGVVTMFYARAVAAELMQRQISMPDLRTQDYSS